jgi:hypothetical protein
VVSKENNLALFFLIPNHDSAYGTGGQGNFSGNSDVCSKLIHHISLEGFLLGPIGKIT